MHWANDMSLNKFVLLWLCKVLFLKLRYVLVPWMTNYFLDKVDIFVFVGFWCLFLFLYLLSNLAYRLHQKVTVIRKRW